MDKIYTETLLIRYYYRETDLFETLELEHAMDEDIDLRSEYKVLKKTLDAMKISKFSPSQKSVNKILLHSKKMAV